MVLVSSGLEAKSAGLGVGLGLELSGLGLGLAFKQDQDLINFYCAISATKYMTIILYITEIHCPRFDMMHASLDFMQSLNCICLIYQRHLRQLKGCSATVA